MSGDAVSIIVQQPQYGVIVVQPDAAAAPAPTGAALSVVGTPPEKAVFVFSQSGGRDGATGPQGPQGPAGVDATVHARRYEESGNYIYLGTAPTGSAEGAAVWRITRITYAAGTQTASGVATAATWTGRAGHTYI